MTAAASLPGLVRHELRLALRGRKGVGFLVGIALLGLWILAGIALAVPLEDTPLRPSLVAYAVIAAVALGMLSFMTTQAMLASQQTLYGAGDIDLLLTAPVPPRIVLLAKTIGIAGTVTLTYFALILPILLPVAILGHPRLLGGVALLVALALLAAALGTGLTLLLARAAGPRAARTVGQVAAAVMGGAIFLVFQLNNAGNGRGSVYRGAYDWMHAHGLGTQGWTSWPGRAAFGEPLPLLAILALGVGAFAAVGWAMQHQFLAGYQDAGMRLARTRARPSRRRSGRLFHTTLFRTVFAKEWRLLARDPALAFQIMLRLIYMAPLFFVALRTDHHVPLAPTFAFASVLIVGQLAGSFAWLAVSAEDAPELLTVAPVDRVALDRIKLYAALAMAAPFALPLPLAIIGWTVAGAAVTLVFTVLGGIGAGWVELKLGKPAPRSTFAKRRQGSLVAGLLGFAVTAICGAAAAVAVYALG